MRSRSSGVKGICANATLCAALIRPGRTTGRASKTEKGPSLSSRSGSTTEMECILLKKIDQCENSNTLLYILLNC